MKKYNFDVYNKPIEEQLVDEVIGKKIIHHFDIFFNVKLNKTKRNYTTKSKTHKRRK